MFLITTDFTCRVADVVKIVPRTDLNEDQYGRTSGTLVYINNHLKGVVDKEFTSMSYQEVLQALDIARAM